MLTGVQKLAQRFLFSRRPSQKLVRQRLAQLRQNVNPFKNWCGDSGFREVLPKRARTKQWRERAKK